MTAAWSFKAVLLQRFTLIFMFCCLVLYSYTYIKPRKQMSSFERVLCDVPDLDPFDKSLADYLKNPLMCYPEQCKYVQPLLLYMDSEDVIRVNQTLAKRMRKFHCNHRWFWLVRDKKLKFSAEISNTLFPLAFAENQSFVEIKCFLDSLTTYLEVFARTNIAGTSGHASADSPHVFILVLESMSRLNYLRYLHQTRKFLSQKLQSTTFSKVIKIADNSYPNMMPLLTGIRHDNVPSQLRKKGPFDKWPLIWKKFSAAGYKTLFLEDDPAYTLFNYYRRGFEKQPTDVYPRAYFMHINGEVEGERDYCVRGHSFTDRFLNILHRFFVNNRDRHRLFSYAFLIMATHACHAEAKHIDPLLRRFFDNLYNQNALDDTIVIVMGDHGPRYGKLMETNVGFLESRLPLFTIHIPEPMRRKYPHIQEFVDVNSKRLVVWDDVHALLKDIARRNYDPTKARKTSKYGISLINREVPAHRSCEDAGVPMQYCLCFKASEVNTTRPDVVNAAQKLAQIVNDKLSVHKGKCHILNVLDVQKALVAKTPTGKFIDISVYMTPGNGLFGARLAQNRSDYKLVGVIDRYNAYGDTSKCIEDVEHQKYCLCKDAS